jgi:glycolate oxidase iron-sulfur subunit
MQHNISASSWQEKIGPQLEEMTQAIESCVHCGFCLPVCPTYQVLGEEMDSPRGRIFLMKSVLEGDLSFQDASLYIDRCLGCLACVTACPSGVKYGELVSPYRAYAQSQVSHTLMERARHMLVKETLPHRRRFRSATSFGRLAKPIRNLLPEELGGMLSLLPEKLPPTQPLPELIEAEGERRARVALLIGCVQHVLAPEINWATLRVLARNGVEVVIPQDQVCCGALLMHTGDYVEARDLARQNLAVFPRDVDAVLTNAAGCGSGMKEYELLFKGLEEEQLAGEFARRVQDISQFLVELGVVEASPLPQALRVAYHDACHLAHAQGILEPPRRLLAAIPNLTLLEIADSGTCCGSAGTYSLEQPEIAAQLGKLKAHNILESGGEAVVTGNIGCMVQISNSLKGEGKMLPVFHTIELLDLAYRRDA